MDNDKAISTLNNLIETLKDGEEGFRTASEGLTDPQTKALFLEYSRERGRMAQDLQGEVRKIGGDPEKSGSVAGSVHRGWINIKSAVTGKSDASIIAEAEAGEDIAKSAFEKAETADLSLASRAIVQEQSLRVRAAHDRVRDLKRATSN